MDFIQGSFQYLAKLIDLSVDLVLAPHDDHSTSCVAAERCFGKLKILHSLFVFLIVRDKVENGISITLGFLIFLFLFVYLIRHLRKLCFSVL